MTGEAGLLMTWAVVLLSAGCHPDVQFGSKSGNFDPPAVLPYSSQARFAVTVNLSDELAYVSADAPQLLGEMPVGDVPVELEGPHHIAGSPDGKYLYVNLSNYVPGTGSGPHGSHGTGTVPGSLLKIDAKTSEKVAEVIVDRSPGDVILSKDGKLAFVTHYDLLRLQSQLAAGDPPEKGFSAIAVVDTARMIRLSLTPVCPTAHGEGLSPDEKTLYVTCALSDELAVVDVSNPSKPTVTMKLPVGPAPGPVGTPSYSPYALSVDPADGTVWVSNNSSADVRVYDPATMMMDDSKTVFTGGVSMFGAFTRDGKSFYVPHQGDDRVTWVETATLAEQTLALPQSVCLNAHALVMAPDDKSAVVVCEGDHLMRPGTVVTLNLEGFFIVGSVEVGLFPDGAAWLPPAP
jgi:DNA-binding beta-propeller fold protein YncE